MLDDYPILASGLIAFAAAAVLTPVMMRISKRTGFVDNPAAGKHKSHREPVPYGGGVAVWAAVAAVFALSAAGLLPDDPTGVALRLFAAGSGFALLGFLDDRFKLSVWLRLGVQIGLAVGLAASGVAATAFVGGVLFSWLLTAVWIAGIANAFNFQDNMDGACAGTSVVIAVSLTVIALQSADPFAPYIASVAGAFAGFLLWNRPPAKIYMGDAGSMFAGSTLAAATIALTFFDDSAGAHRVWQPLFVPLVLFAVPIFDMLTVLWIRFRAGKPLTQGDQNHFSHRLVALGLSRRRAVAVLVGMTAVTATAAPVLQLVGVIAGFALLVQTVLLMAIIHLLERGGAKSRTPSAEPAPAAAPTPTPEGAA